MAQASQQLPSWLTLSSTLVTELDGSVSTSFATLRLPLTYYGPSIPLGTDGVWTYGGLTPPPTISTQPTSATPSSIPPTLLSSSAPASQHSATPTPTASLTSPPLISATSQTPASSTSAASSTSSGISGPPSGHGVSSAVLGIILGCILGAMLLLVVILTMCLLRRNRRSRDAGHQSSNTSSFWNRSTTIFTWTHGNSEKTQTPIWTGWEFMEAGSAIQENGRPFVHLHNPSLDHFESARTPGEGSPRGSGEETDPFLTRRGSAPVEGGIRSRAGSDPILSVPAAAAIGSNPARPSPTRGGHIIPRDVLLRMAEQDEFGSPYDIRIVEPSPSQDMSPLLPPPPLDPDGLMGLGVRQARRASDKSIGSQNTQGHSLHSEKSSGSLDQADRAELLVARRVRVGDLARTHSRLPTIESDPGTVSSSHSALGLSGLGGRLGRLSWFKRISSPTPVAVADTYTRTPPRSSRNGSHSRPGSWSRLMDDVDAINGTPGPSARRDSGLGLGLLTAGSRPMSSVSAKSHTSASGNTVYYDARSRPTSFAPLDFPVPVTSEERQRELAHLPADNRVTLSDAYFDIPANPPPAYDDTLPRLRGSNIDILDIPAPSSASPFTTSRPVFPPASARSSSGISIDIEDDPPSAQEEWRDLAADGRRRTFGTSNVVNPPAAHNSQYPSLHSFRSYLRLEPSQASSHSALSSGHSNGGSASSRPSARSQLLSARSDVSRSSASNADDQDELGQLSSPPISAVMGSFGSQQPSRSSSAHPQPATGIAVQPYITPTSSRAPLLGGTVTSATTTGTDTNSSVTTALTDPITGAYLHFPSLPWANDSGSRRRSDGWPGNQEDAW